MTQCCTHRNTWPGIRAGKFGFTLIELLSVIAIVGVLGAIVTAAVLKAKNRANQLKCISNVRQLSAGVSLFVTDHGEYPLGMNKGFSEGKDPAHSTAWMVSIQKQLVSGAVASANIGWLLSGIWDCPSATKPTDWGKNDGYQEYGYNANGLGVGEGGSALGLGGHFNPMSPTTAPAVKADEVMSPSETISVGDGFSGWKGVIQDGLWSITRWPAAMEYRESSERSRKRHSGRANMAFCDGHVESLTLDSLFLDTSDSALKRWNRDGQPHRERLAP